LVELIFFNLLSIFFTSLTFKPIEGSSWDLDKGLAFYLKVSFNFTVIHDFLPQYKDCGLRIAPEPIPEVVPKNPKPTPPVPTPTPPVTGGGGGGITNNPVIPNLTKINMEMLRDDTQLKSISEKNIEYLGLKEAQLAALNRSTPRRQFQGFGDPSNFVGGGAGAVGDWGNDPKFKDKIIAKKQAIDKDPKLLLSTQKYYF
jgi:hypothetical protein